MEIKEIVAIAIQEQVKEHWSMEDVLARISPPKYAEMGDLALPCFELAKVYRQSPQTIAENIVSKLVDVPLIDRAEAVSGYVNVFFNKELVAAHILKEVLTKQAHYGDLAIGNQEAVTIDFSSPNIAKPFSMGHLRSTVIGNSLAYIMEKCGYTAVRINHLGDWGTQFGKLMVAYRLWGKEQDVKQRPIQELLKLYVRFHEEAEQDESLNDEARLWFKKLEEGNAEARSLWTWFREESLQEFSKIYELMSIRFDSTNGEAFYNDKMDRVVQLLEEKNLLEASEGAQVVQVGDDVPPCLIKKKDGTTLYATRDLAAALYRQKTYAFVKSLYVVGNEQTLHFKQVFRVIEKMGYTWHEGMTHVPFGMMLQNGKKMSTRKGKVVLLEDVLNDAIALAEKNIAEKNPTLRDSEVVARQVGVGAVLFHDLKNFRMNDIEFSLEDMLKVEGETGPYVQYSHARASTLLKKGAYAEGQSSQSFVDAEAWATIKLLGEFPEAIRRAYESYDPSQIAKYLLELSRAFNKYYGSVRILDDATHKHARLDVVKAVQIVLSEGLRLLGMTAPKEM
ncbi:arginine--tRNA ligase [Chryseomicrobium palamuruense]|uniref:Arginine--tRNA ligase n=1 Tax=Chryseomicrobium palamuruense TaxID=682973 RepID=A0ABV8UYW9_9BACL